MTNTAIKNKDIETRKATADADRKQSDINSRRAAVAQVIAGGLKAAPWKKLNNPEWYKRYISTDVNTNIPSFLRNGSLVDESGSPLLGDMTNTYLNSNPGIMVVPYIDTFGSQIGDHKVSAINEGLKRFMAQLRKFNSRVGDYEPADIGLYLIACTDIAKFLEFVRKMLACYKFYRSQSLYTAKELINALGFDYDDVVMHYPDYKSAITKAIVQFNTQLVLPSGLSYVNRKLWLASLAVQDHSGEKASLYLTRPWMIWTMSSSETSIIPTTLPYGGSTIRLTYNAIFGPSGYLPVMFRRLVESSSFQVMMADLRAGIPESDMIKLPEFDASTTLNPDVATETLEQLHNLETLPGSMFDSNISLTDYELHSASDGYLWFGSVDSSESPDTAASLQVNFPTASAFANSSAYTAFKSWIDKPLLLNFYKEKINGDDILEATRLKYVIYCTYTPITGGGARYNIDPSGCCTEIVPRLEIVHINSANSSNIESIATYSYSFINQSTYATAPFFEEDMAQRFDWCPLIRHCGNGNLNANWVKGELDNYFPLNQSELRRLHEQCLLSMFYLPEKVFSGFRH